MMAVVEIIMELIDQAHVKTVAIVRVENTELIVGDYWLGHAKPVLLGHIKPQWGPNHARAATVYAPPMKPWWGVAEIHQAHA